MFTLAFGLSIGTHLLLLSGRLLSWQLSPSTKRLTPIDVVYEYQLAQQELRSLNVLKEHLARTARDNSASPSPAAFGVRQQIRIPDRPSLTATQDLHEFMPTHSAVVDLTNLVDASRGDPVLLSYFSAIREQIQQTANRRNWVSGPAAGGMVYVSFVLAAGGVIRGVEIVAERSITSGALQESALRIIKGAAPFPPFPPSMNEPQKTIVVPLEFLLNNS